MPGSTFLSTVIACALSLYACVACNIALAAEDARTPVERVAQPRGGSTELRLARYIPSANERRFFERLAPAERHTGSELASYEITTKNGVYVGWFGIVRMVEEDDARQETRLTIEHKYFNGLTGERIQTVSFNGAGDFQVVMRGLGHQIDLYALVNVYGEVWSDEPGHAPRIEAEYVRLWPWGAFSFAAAYGTQQGSEAWRKLNTVALEEIYDAKPTRRYYQERLGLRPQDKVRAELRRRRREFLHLSEEIAESLPAEQRAIVERLPGALLAGDNLAIDEVIWASTTAESDRAIARILGLAIELGDDRVRDEAISNLYEYDLVLGEVLPALIRTLLDNDIPTQSWAFRLLQRFGPDAAPAVPTLLAALKQDDSVTRSGACGVLASIGPGAAPALDALVRATRDEDRGVRESAVYAIAALGPLAEKALPRLTEILEGDDDATVRGSAARAIAAVDTKRTESVAILIEALMDDESFVREAAAAALGSLGRAAASAAKPLSRALEDDSLGVRVAAAESLWRVSNEAAASVTTLVHVLEVGDVHERVSALFAIGAMRAKAQGAVPALVAVLDDDNEWFAAHGDSMHELAIDALGSVGIAAAPAVPHLMKKLEEEDARIRARAAVALWRIKRYENSLTLLIDTLRNDDALLVYPALEALRDIGPDAIQAVPEIVKLQSHEVRGIRQRAAAALEAIDPTA